MTQRSKGPLGHFKKKSLFESKSNYEQLCSFY
jgi:hypothetical protein